MFGWFKKKDKFGILEKIELTFGGAGNQVMTIDGYEYATWVDHTCWPKIGSRIRFVVYTQGDGRGATLRCARLLEDLGVPRG